MAKKKSSSKKYNLLYFVPAIIWMAVIFIFSSYSGDQSTTQSNVITELITNVFANIRGEITTSFHSTVEVIVRKTAHITEYAILFALLYMAFVKNNSADSKTFNKVISFAIAFLYACSDEFHQLFITDRAGVVSDVFIDMLGPVLLLIYIKLFSGSHTRVMAIVVTAVIFVALFMWLALANFA